MTVRGGGVPCHAMAFVPPLRMGPPPRSLAADAHACIMVRVTAIHRIQGCGVEQADEAEREVSGEYRLPKGELAVTAPWDPRLGHG